MILGVPYHPAITDYKTLISDLRKRGQLLNHSLVVICHPDHEAEAYGLGTELSDMFQRSANSVVASSERRKFGLSNDFFRAAVRYVESYKSKAGELEDPAILYLDPTYRPARSNWMDSIQAEYYLNNAPKVFGKSKTDDDGAKIFQGPLVISKNYYKSSGLINFMPENTQWREYLKWELTKNSVETNLIGNGSQDSVLKPLPSKK